MSGRSSTGCSRSTCRDGTGGAAACGLAGRRGHGGEVLDGHRRAGCARGRAGAAWLAARGWPAVRGLPEAGGDVRLLAAMAIVLAAGNGYAKAYSP